ncbi:MAG: pyridoxamine 5'-phosphate oxidase family protein [Acidimicrobiales bacterium]
MRTPDTTIDRRYSDPHATPTPWDVTQRELETAELFWLTTVRRDGRPHVTPLVAVWHDGALFFTTGSGEQKERNLRENRHVILMTGRNDWREGLDVVLEGDAQVVTSGSVLDQLGEVWSAKWDGRWRFFARDDHFFHPDGFEVLPFMVKPSKVLVFAKGTFAHTVHLFD